MSIVALMILRLSLVGNQRQPAGHWFSCLSCHWSPSVAVDSLDQRRSNMFLAIGSRRELLINRFHVSAGYLPCSSYYIYWSQYYLFVGKILYRSLQLKKSPVPCMPRRAPAFLVSKRVSLALFHLIKLERQRDRQTSGATGEHKKSRIPPAPYAF